MDDLRAGSGGETIDGGAGEDTAVVDALDTVAANCETVDRRAVGS